MLRPLAPSPLTERAPGRNTLPARRHRNFPARFLVPLADATVIATSLVLAVVIAGNTSLQPPLSQALSAVTIIVAWIVAIALAGGYSQYTLLRRAVPLKKLFTATLAVFGSIAFVDALAGNLLPSAVFAVGLPLGVVGLILTRFVLHRLVLVRTQMARQTQRSVILSPDDEYAELAHAWGAPLSRPVARICPSAAMKSHSPADYVLRELNRHGAGKIIISPSCGFSPQQSQALRWRLEDANVETTFQLPFHGVAANRLHVEADVKSSQVTIDPARYRGVQFAVRRLVDLVLAGVGIVLLLPVWIAVSAAIKLTDGGPIFFSQPRMGHNGKVFKMLKFRSMKTNAEDLLEEIEDQQDSGNELLFKVKDDPRVTRIGQILRRYSIDELPQLFNVLRGDMTLIGPRPPLSREVANYEPEVLRKFMVKPGLTGLWQVMGRSNLSWEDSVYLDLYYTENCNLALDASIMSRTAKAVLSADGAY